MSLSIANDVDALFAQLAKPYTRAWSPSRKERLRRAFAGDVHGLLESDLTDLLAATQGEDETLVAAALLDAAGLRDLDPDEVQLVTRRDLLRRWKGSRAFRAPDLFLVHDDALKVVVEAKGRALVNAGRPYCRDDTAVYSNQVICYPHGCWVEGDLRAAAEQAAYVWLGAAATVDPFEGPWGYKAISQRDVEKHPDLYTEPYARQTAARPRWSALTWESLADALAVTATGARLGAVIRAWASR